MNMIEGNHIAVLYSDGTNFIYRSLADAERAISKAISGEALSSHDAPAAPVEIQERDDSGFTLENFVIDVKVALKKKEQGSREIPNPSVGMYRCEIFDGNGETHLHTTEEIDKLDFQAALAWAEKLSAAWEIIINDGPDGEIPTKVVGVWWEDAK